LSTHALKTSDRVGGNAPPSAPAPAGDQGTTDSLGLKLLRNLDFLVLLLVLPVFILADLPLVGYATDYANGVYEEATALEELMRLIAASGETFATTLQAAVARVDEAALEPVGTHFRWD